MEPRHSGQLKIFRSAAGDFKGNFIHALGLIKYASAKANFELGLMGKRMAKAIEKASSEVSEGKMG